MSFAINGVVLLPTTSYVVTDGKDGNEFKLKKTSQFLVNFFRLGNYPSEKKKSQIFIMVCRLSLLKYSSK